MIFLAVLIGAVVIVGFIAINEDRSEADREARNRESHRAWIEEDNLKWQAKKEGVSVQQLEERKIAEGKKKYCSHCGKEIQEEAVICPHCGCAVEGKGYAFSNERDETTTGLKIACFLIPLAGLIIYLTSHDRTPKKANDAGKFALFGLGIGVVSCIIWYSMVLSNTGYYY